MRLVLLLAAALMLAGLGSATVYTFTAAQFEAMVAGLPIPGVDSASDAGYGRRHTGVWVVRFTMPWETVGHNRTNDFVVASDLVPSAIARFAELPINTVDELFIADTLSVSLPEIRAFNGPVARLEIPRGTVFPSDRPSRPVARYVATPGEELASLVRFVFDNVPSSYEEESTSEVVASMRVFSTKKDLLSALQLAQREASGLAHATPAVAKAATLSHVAVALSSKDPFTRAQVLAAALAAGTMNRGRGGVRVFVITGAGFSDVALTGFDFTVATVSLSGDKSDFTLSNAVGGKSLDDIAHRAFALADAIESVEEVKQHAKSVLTAARAGATRYLAPVDLDRPQRHPLRRLDTTEQFMKEVVELKNGVAVVFFLRESDKFYSKHLKIAKKLAEMTVRDFSANVPGQENVQRRYDVFLVDAEVHKNVARDLRVDKVPSVACLIGLRDHPDKKGLRFYKSKDGLDKPEAINKWMRTDIFDGRDTAIVDPYVVRFSSPVPASTLDLSLQTEYFDTNPRRFHYAPTSTPDLYTQTLDDAKSATGSPLNVNAQKKDTGKGAKAQESAKEAAQREKVAAKQRELAEKRKAKLKEELEAKEAAKKKKMADKEAVEKSAAEKRKAEAEQRAKEEAERRAREEADGTAERRRAAAKAKKARAERAAKLKKAKLAAKEKKDRATLMKLWAEDAAVAAQKHSFVGADGEVRIVDRIL